MTEAPKAALRPLLDGHAPLFRHRRLILVALLIGACACLGTAWAHPITPRASSGGEGDVALYRAIVTRVRAGEGYYDATHDELLSRHYGMRSVLNWRPPTLAYLVAAFPDRADAKGLLVAVGAAALLLAVAAMKQQGGLGLACLLGLWLPGALLASAVGDTFLFSELWAGTLILLSMLLYARRPILSASLAVVAMFLRELAAPYAVLVGVVLADDLRRARRDGERTRAARPFLVLLLGLCTYAAFFAWHACQVRRHLLPTDPAYASGWIRFGGWSFLLATARQNAWLLVLPQWVTALYLPVAVLGLFAWPGPTARLARPTCLGYLAFFAVAGKSFNDYWGLLIAPTLCLAFCFGLKALWSMVRRLPLEGASGQAGHEVLLQREE